MKWKVLQCETGILSGGDRRFFMRITGEKRRVTGDNNNIIIIIIIIIIIVIINIHVVIKREHLC